MVRDVIMKSLAFLYRKLFRPYRPRWDWPQNEVEERKLANEVISNLLSRDEPCFIGRLGTVEGQIVWNYLSVHSNLPEWKKLRQFIIGKAKLPWWDKKQFFELQNNAGFFSPNMGIDEVEKFCELYLKYIPQMDVCGSFEYYERFIPFSDTCQKFQLETLYPFYVDNSWMRVLRGKNILVIHPFKSTIETQYLNNRELLFPNKDWLPEFASLVVIKAVQSIAGEKTGFQSWFEALDYMKAQIDKIDFDVAIIGCGAYGLPLAGYCKEKGKKAIHLGGGTQLLFGIKGKRWEQQYQNSCYRDLFNEYWVYPSEKERPKSASKVEDACYW